MLNYSVVSSSAIPWAVALQAPLLFYKLCIKIVSVRDFPAGPVVKTITVTAGGMGSIPGGGTKIPHATLCGQ